MNPDYTQTNLWRIELLTKSYFYNKEEIANISGVIERRFHVSVWKPVNEE